MEEESVVTDKALGVRPGGRNRRWGLWKRKIRSVWQVVEWPLVATTWVVALILGCVGMGRYAAASGEAGTVLDHVYHAVQLIVLESGDIHGPLPWQLDVARFLLPAVAGYAAVQALLAIFREQWQLVKVRFVKKHAVVCGLGERGLRLAQEFLDHGYRVVGVEADEENPLIDRCREQGAVVLVGDATDKNLLKRSGVRRAKYLVTVCADDGTNAEIALHARDLVRTRPGRALSAYVHIVDLELCNLLSGGELASAEADAFRMEFFNVFERGARLMLKEHAPFGDETRPADRGPRLLVVGLGKLGRSLVVQAAREWWMVPGRRETPLRICVIDNGAERKVASLLLQYPQLGRACTFDVRQLEKNDPEFERGDFLYDSEHRFDVDAVYICFDDDVHVLVNALTLNRNIKPHAVPIVVRMSREAGLATLMKEGRGAFDFGNLDVFGLLDKTCSLEALLGGTHELLARAIHEDYVRHQKEEGNTPETNPSMVGWDELPEPLKESNRHQADHIDVKLKAIGCGLQALTDWEAVTYEDLSDEVKKVFDVELLARMEHDRWCEERRLHGWRYAPGPKNIKKKTTPYLVAWEDLDKTVKDLDRNAVRALPAILAQAGFQIYRRA
jgi:hypothetical protein